MERLETLSHALRFIEMHLQEPLAPEDVADSCGYSLSALQKLFRYAFHIGVKDYIARRRITSAARELLTTQDTVLAIALRYGYDSHEVFTRAFRRIWGETPSGFRRERRFCDIYPKLNPLFNREKLERGGYVTVQQFENTLLYDAMQTMHGTWAVALDTRRLQEINETYGRPAGDLVIAECIRRIDSLRGEGMLFFRIGGDEFILLTGSGEEDVARRTAERIAAPNGQPICFGGVQIPVAMRYALTRLNTAAPDREMIRQLDWRL